MYILSNKIKYCTKDIFKITRFMLMTLFVVLAIIMIKYNPIYEVSINGEVIGYVSNKVEFEDRINSEVLTSNNPNAIFMDLDVKPSYELKIASNIKTNEEDIINTLSKYTTTMYKIYAITLDNEVKSYVNTWDEAEEIVENMKAEYSDSIELNIAVTEKYTENINDLTYVDELAEAQTSIDNDLRTIVDEQIKIATATCNGVYLSVKPVSGNITSRFGANESVRNHTHAGLDIAAPAGTSIRAAAGGIISYSGWMSGYGYLIIIDHDNGVQTYYGHCSKLYVGEGASVEAGDIIAAVGSTGNSTGNHLHFEIRVDGVKVDPQTYIYN